jgi:hypothetical protein
MAKHACVRPRVHPAATVQIQTSFLLSCMIVTRERIFSERRVQPSNFLYLQFAIFWGLLYLGVSFAVPDNGSENLSLSP